jgi:hypothetical protein
VEVSSDMGHQAICDAAYPAWLKAARTPSTVR